MSNVLKYLSVTSWSAFALLASGFAVEAAQLPQIANTRVHSPALISSGQPGKRQFRGIAESGVQVVINLAPKNLPDSLRNEEKLTRSSGMEYFFIPVDWGKPAQSDFDQFLTAMDSVKGKTVLAHCWVNARSSAFVYLYRILREGAAQEAEHKVLEEIWENNKGYELRNVPQWRAFLDEALARHRK